MGCHLRPWAASYIQKTTETADANAEAAAEKEIAKYENLCNQKYLFQPLALAILDPWSKSTKDFIKDIGQSLERTLSGDGRSLFY